MFIYDTVMFICDTANFYLCSYVIQLCSNMIQLCSYVVRYYMFTMFTYDTETKFSRSDFGKNFQKFLYGLFMSDHFHSPHTPIKPLNPFSDLNSGR